jgi:hypothetical protein
MIRKVWVCFDDEDNIIEVCTNADRNICNVQDCEQYIMKLIPIDREMTELEKEVEDFVKTTKDFDEVVKGFERSSRKLKRSLDRFKI